MTAEAASTPEGLHMTNDTRHDPLAELSDQGVAVWLDDLSRELLASGELQLLITGRHVVGVTTNPTFIRSRARPLVPPRSHPCSRLRRLSTRAQSPRPMSSLKNESFPLSAWIKSVTLCRKLSWRVMKSDRSSSLT
jgi:hypothetical protein